jgi:hypothetical protein
MNDYLGIFSAPGTYSGQRFLDFTCEAVGQGAERDGAVQPKIRNGSYSVCPENFHLGHWRLGGGRDGEIKDAHWLRRNHPAPGQDRPIWSQKFSFFWMPTHLDGAGNVIEDPEKAHHVHSWLLGTHAYPISCGYICLPDNPYKPEDFERVASDKKRTRIIAGGVVLSGVAYFVLKRRSVTTSAPDRKRDPRLSGLDDIDIALSRALAKAWSKSSGRSAKKIAKEAGIPNKERSVSLGVLVEKGIISADYKSFADPSLMKEILAETEAEEKNKN